MGLFLLTTPHGHCKTQHKVRSHAIPRASSLTNKQSNSQKSTEGELWWLWLYTASPYQEKHHLNLVTFDRLIKRDPYCCSPNWRRLNTFHWMIKDSERCLLSRGLHRGAVLSSGHCVSIAEPFLPYIAAPHTWWLVHNNQCDYNFMSETVDTWYTWKLWTPHSLLR